MKTKKILALLLSAILLVSCFTVNAQDTITPNVKDSIPLVSATAPIADGTLTEDEYGAPVIVTSPTHISTIEGDSKFVDQGVNDTPSDQLASIYMAHDKEYLYVAATLDHAIVNASGVTNSNGAKFSITLSKYDETYNVYHNDKDQEVFYYAISRFSGANSTTCNPNYGCVTDYVAPGKWKQEAVTVNATFANSTYVHEMRIPWSAIPGMENGVDADGELAFTIQLADGTATGGKQNYYQIGGQAAGILWNSKGDKSVMTIGLGQEIIRHTVAAMPSSAPIVNGTITKGEYGDPIIVTTPSHAATDGDVLQFVKVNDVSDAQTAKIYMTNDEDYLYVAATLDHATVNGSSVGQDKGAAFRITLAKYDATNNIYQKTFGWFAVRFKEDSATYGSGLRKVIGTKDGGALQADLIGKYADNAYTYEMRIPWSQIPGMENGMYADNDLAMTVKFSDGTGTPDQYNYYQIGGTAASNIWGADHSTVHTVTINEGIAKDTVSDMPAVAPTVDGMLNAGEYGEPVIVTSQNHAATLEGNSMFVNRGTNTTPRAQRATIYMTNDEEYLYIAATLDHAIAVNKSLPKECNGLFAVMLSNTESMFKNDAGKKEYFWGISRFNVGVSSPTGGSVLGTAYTANASVSIVGAYDNGTYVHEMRIPWSAIPGMESGINTEGKLAINLMLTDGGGGTTSSAPKQNYYQIGDAEANSIYNAKHNQAMALNVCKEANFMIDDVTYFTVDKALDAAKSGDTVTLLKDATVSELNVMNGVKFDLNGKVLTADLVLTTVGGGMIQDNTNGQGGIKIAKNTVDKENHENSEYYLILMENNPQLPLYDTSFNGYRFFECTTTQLNTETGTCKFGFRFTLTNNDAYDLLADAVNADMELVTDLKLDIDGQEKAKLDYHFNPTNVATYAAEKKNDSASTWAIILKITGFGDLKGDVISMTSAPSIQSSTGVKIVPTENTPATYTYQKGE